MQVVARGCAVQTGLAALTRWASVTWFPQRPPGLPATGEAARIRLQLPQPASCEGEELRQLRRGLAAARSAFRYNIPAAPLPPRCPRGPLQSRGEAGGPRGETQPRSPHRWMLAGEEPSR